MEFWIELIVFDYQDNLKRSAKSNWPELYATTVMPSKAPRCTSWFYLILKWTLACHVAALFYRVLICLSGEKYPEQPRKNTRLRRLRRTTHRQLTIIAEDNRIQHTFNKCEIGIITTFYFVFLKKRLAWKTHIELKYFQIYIFHSLLFV